MGQTIETWWKVCKNRWKATMPKFFRRMMYLCALISGSSLAANTAIITAGTTPHEWWSNILPYLVGVPAGVMFACKFTVDGGFRDKTVNKHSTDSDIDSN